ncbi:protein spaetzle isoform X2 [Drosophila bipectinata]|uniref:protein spaetzle isoform X2 n=1 Tax=Drosophila bipectinata TaxID=42026 RepID=UPI001C89DBE5|nr:protein spaetzle isoform X2 [Drosophila bipectinata]
MNIPLYTSKPSDMMQHMWFRWMRILVLLFALFATVVFINSEIAKRRKAEAALAALMGNPGVGQSGFEEYDQEPNPGSEEFASIEANKDYDTLVRSIFVTNDNQGVQLFNTTTMDNAPLMPINTMLGDQPQNPIPNPNQNQKNQTQAPKPRSSTIYHQYHSLNQQQDQYFKVQRSPDGKLNLVFNDTFVSLQDTTPQPQADQTPPTHRQPSDRHGPRPIYPAHSPAGANNTAALQQCGDVKPESRSFCTQVENYPDLSGLKMTLSSKFSKFFSDAVPTDVSARVGIDADDTIYLCRVTPRTIFPKMGLTTQNNWELIVNTDEFKQAIQIEECEVPDAPCDFTDSFPNGYRSSCKQHYMTRNLISIKDEGPLDPSPESFRIPSCCKCVLKRV